MLRKACGISAAIALLAAIAGIFWGTPTLAETPKRGGTLNVGFPSDTKTLDPLFSVQFTERQVLYLVYNTLTKLGTDFSINPELATSWDVENDGKRIVFHLRKGVKFQDGSDFNADVVKWNLEQRLDESVGSPQRKQLEPVIDSLEVIDKYTIAINLKRQFPALLGMLGQRAGFMVSPTAAKKYGKDLGSHPVGTGPFVFKEWVRGSHITLERNPNYWEKGLPYLDKVVFQDISGSVVGLQRLITGELDYVGQLAPNDIRPIENSDKLDLYPITVGRWYSLQWHWNEPPFNNSDLRKAIAYAIDRKRIVDITMDGKANVANGPTPSALWWFDPNIKGYAYNPDKAKELLAKAGYKPGTELVLWTPQISVLQQIDQLVQEQLGAVGVTVKLSPVAQKEWYSRVVKRATNWTPMRWTQRPDPDGLLYILFHSKGYANTTGYNNPEVDALLDQARGSSNMEARKKIYFKVQQILADDLPYVPLFFSVEYAAMGKNIKNFAWIPDQIPRFREIWKSN
jgi:peptide/nickel transport system substrate-binding protein